VIPVATPINASFYIRRLCTDVTIIPLLADLGHLGSSAREHSVPEEPSPS
jgi:hypothetical protein